MIFLSDVKTVVGNYAAAVGVGVILGAMASLFGLVFSWAFRFLRSRS